MKITLKQKSVYGNVLLYPACPQSEIFALLIGAKTFNTYHISHIEKLGYGIEIIKLP